MAQMKPWERYGTQTKQPSPTLPYEAPQAAATLTRTQQEINLANATAAAQAAKAKADAITAEVGAKTAQEQYAAQHPPVQTSGLYGADYLKTLSPADQATVKALDEGRLAFPMNAGMRSPFWQEKLSQVAQYDPTFDATNFNARAKGRAAAISGKLGTSNNALNTAMGHLGQLYGQIGGTASHGGFPFATTVNAVENAFERGTGDPGVTNFQDTAQKLADELESVYRNGGGAEQGVVRQLRSLDVNASQAQKEGVIRNAMDLIASKAAANLAQYNFGTGGKPSWDMLDQHTQDVLSQPQFKDIRDKYFAAPVGATGAPPNNGGGNAPSSGGNAPPPIRPDYSGMVGGPQSGLAVTNPNSNAGAFAQTYRTAFDPVGAQAISAFIRNGAPVATANEYATSHGFQPINPDDYAKAVAFAKAHHGATNVEADRSVPTTLGERLASSPAAAFVSGAASGGTAGLADVVGRSILGPSYDANKVALAATQPGADALGNVAGGVGASFAAPELLAKYAPGPARVLADFAKANPRLAPVLGDAAYGGTYGASENPANPLKGAAEGAAIGGGAGIAGRGAVRTLGNLVAPQAGQFAPLYDAGVFPTPGQRFAKSGIAGRILNTTEQAMQSAPILGMAPASARQATRDAFQVGAFNNSLKELAPFQGVADVSTSLPKGTGAGTNAHAFAKGEFDKAYNVARSGMQFVPDPKFAQDAGAFDQALTSNGILNGEQVGQVQKAINNAVGSRLNASGGVLSGDAYKAAASDLDKTISAWSKNQNTAPMASALSDYASIFDNAARRNSNPQAVNLLDAADRGYAQLVRIQRASELGGAAKDAGTFTPNNFAAATKQMGGGVRSSAYNTGNALGQDYAEAGLNLSDKLADSGTPIRVATLGALQAGEGGALAAAHSLGALAHPATLAAFAPYAPVLRNFVNRAIAPNAQRLSFLPPNVVAGIDALGNKINNIAPIVGKGVVPFTLADLMGR